MNKTVNINLGGIFFHIDEDAYKKLKKYLEAIRKSLSDDPQGKDEILKDIEYRIGEILSESVKDVRQVVNEQDIDDIILIMGKPEQYAGDEEFFDDEETIYSSNKKRKKLFRDSDDKFLGGVSSGLGHYFNIDVIWIRLAWLLLLVSGFSVILYPILWILLPETKSTSDKLEMEGEDVNISNIERKIKEGFEEASQIVRDGIDDASEKIKRGNYESKVKSGLQEIIGLIARVFSAIFKVTGKFIGGLLIFVSVVTLFSVIAGAFSLGSIEFLGLSKELTSYPPFFYTSKIPKGLLTTFLFIAVGIPFVFLFKLGLKIVSNNVSSFSRATNLSLFGVWLLSIMAMAFAGIEYGANSSNSFSASKKHIINHNVLDTLNIKMIVKDNFKPIRTGEISAIVDNGITKLYRTNIELDIRESNTNEMYLTINKKAKAISIKRAVEFANEIEYNFEVIDNNLILDGYFLSNFENKYQSQYIRMTLYVPEEKTIYLDKSTKYFLRDIDNIQDIYGGNMIKHYFKMVKDGLNCLDCENKEVEKNENIKVVKAESKLVDKEISNKKENIIVKKNDTIKTVILKKQEPQKKKILKKIE